MKIVVVSDLCGSQHALLAVLAAKAWHARDRVWHRELQLCDNRLACVALACIPSLA